MTLHVHKRGLGKRNLLLLCAVLILTGLLFGGWYVLEHRSSPKKQETTHTQTPLPAPKPLVVTTRALFSGDVYWGRYTNEQAQKSPLGTAYPFSRLNEFHRDNYDAWVADLECPVTSGAHPTAAEEEATLTFNCSPDYLPEAAKWFTVFSLANNHTDNQGGQAGVKETRQHLETNGIQYFGNPDPEILDDVCEVVSFPVHYTMSDTSVKKGFLPVALCGYHGVFKIPSAASLAVMQKYSKVMPVIAYPHSGAEYKPAPDEIKTTLYRAMIDNGADVVLGDHPHWIQPTESYKGHLIVYAMNNFMFDQQFNLEVTRAANVDLTLTLAKNADTSQLTQWLAVGEQCKTFHDDCLATIESKQLTKLDFEWHFAIVASRDDGYLAHPASAADTTAILDRLKWSQTVAQLQPPYNF